MNEYRKEAGQVARDARWTFWRFMPLFVVVVLSLSVLGFGLRSAGLIGGTVVERKVFEESYQRSEAIKSQIATDEATLAEIEHLLTDPELDSSTRRNLQAQAVAARVRIRAAMEKQQ